MNKHTTATHSTTRAAPRTDHRSPRLRGALASTLLLAGVLTLAIISPAFAGTYVINNCPSAGNGNSGPWTVFGSPQNVKGTCGGGPSDYIGPRGGGMNPGTSAGVQIVTPSGITIREAKIWWQASTSSGAETYAVASDNGGVIGESHTPLLGAQPNVFVLASTTTEITLETYCAVSDGANGCSFGGGESNILELYGASLTLFDPGLPSGSVTGGSLAGAGPASGGESLAYTASDGGSGVRYVELVLDGKSVATNDYIAECPYQNFTACPANLSGTISWNTGAVADGSHDLALRVINAGGNSTIVDDHTITTHNAPANTVLPAILTPSQLNVGATLTSQPGKWSAPTGTGTITYAYEWEDCDTQGNNCQPIPGAQNTTYTPTPNDIGHTLRLLVTAADNDGLTSATSSPTSVVLAPQGSLGALPGPGTNSAASASTGGVTSTQPSPAGLGTPNGTTASENAQLHLGIGPAIKRAYPHRAFGLTGRLLDAQADPIAGATLNIIQQIAGSNQAQVIAHAHTRTDGTFAVHVPAGPSRLIEITYQAFSADTSYAAQAEIEETVSASVQLNITPHRTSPNGTITLTGTVQGPVPKRGTIVDLLVHYRGRWEPFRTPRTNPYGHFHVTYQFEGGTGRFPFRAEVPTGQAGFPFSSGYSHVVDVATS